MSAKLTNDSSNCDCGRSPTGDCMGWSDLTVEEYQKKLEEYMQFVSKETKDSKNEQ